MLNMNHFSRYNEKWFFYLIKEANYAKEKEDGY